MRIICWLRSFAATWRAGWPPYWVHGHEYVVQPREHGQPKCVIVFKCQTCNDYHVGWENCGVCGYRQPPSESGSQS